MKRISSTLLDNQKFLKVNMGSNADDVSHFFALFVVIITDGKFFLIVNILKSSFIILITVQFLPLKAFQWFLISLSMQIKILNMSYQVLWDLPCPPSNLTVCSQLLIQCPSAFLDCQVSQPDIAQALLSAWYLLSHSLLCLANP